METMERIERELQLLGITKRYHGYRQAAIAVELALENEECLYNVTEMVYKNVALRCSCGQSCIERNPHRLTESLENELASLEADCRISDVCFSHRLRAYLYPGGSYSTFPAASHLTPPAGRCMLPASCRVLGITPFSLIFPSFSA